MRASLAVCPSRFSRECDDQKNAEIDKACQQVNIDFGQIFSTLLAGMYVGL